MTATDNARPQRKYSTAMRAQVCLSALLVMLQCGCAATPRLLSEPDKARLGTIGVTAARYAPDTRIKGPGQTGGKAGIAIGGLGAAAATVASCLNPLAILTCPSMLLTMTALGATAGGVIGHQINARVTGSEIEAAAPDDVDDARTQRALRDWVIRHARAHTTLDYVAIDDPAPASRADKPDYRPLSGSGIDSVIEVALLELSTEGRPKQGLALAMTSRVRVIRAASGAVIGEEIIRYRSDAHPYEKWIDKDENVFRTALERGYQTIAERIAGELGARSR
jgi:hypothetical protein